MVVTVLTGIVLTLALQTDEFAAPQPPVTGANTEVVFMPPSDKTGKLDGRTLVVRRYEDWENAPDEFEPLSVRVEGNRVAIEPGDTAASSILVIAGEDQKDEAVKAAVHDTIWSRRLTKKCELWLPFPENGDYQSRPWQFVDALGEPLPGAAVEIWLTDYRGPRVRLGPATVDSTGRLARKISSGDLRVIDFIVSHPEYGCAEVREPFDPDGKVVVPLVRRGTTAFERAIHGRVVDPNGGPIAGATIDCTNVRTLGEGLISGIDAGHRGITDANGVFSFYLANRKSRDDRGELIPPKSQYQVRISAPRALGLLPCADPIENGRETTIVLERGDRLRRLRFEDPNGPITDPARLDTITLVLRRPGRNVLMLQPDDWRNGARLVPGVYEASMRSPRGECQFELVTLTKDSPDEVVFRLPAAVTYYGRVVQGITGQPMPGAFVLAMTSTASDMRLWELTTEQWSSLHTLAGDPRADDAALAPLHKMYGFTKLVRTDATGGYGVALEADETFYGFVVFEQDYLAVAYRKHSLQADKDHFAEVPTIRLFPAATVFIETEADKEYLSIMPTWEIDEASRPEWVRELLAADDGRESRLECHDWLKPNMRQAVHVPAGVGLRLKLETPYDEEFCPILIPPAIHLAQGQTADLGQFIFERAIPVQVKVVDSGGRTFEGIPIRMTHIESDGMVAWSVPHNTDEQGIARFHVVPNSSGSFGVLYSSSDHSVHLKETLDYKVAGREDTGREFVFQLSDEMLARLLQ